MKTYTRLNTDGKQLVAHVTKIEKGRVTYYFSNPRKLIREYSNLFFSVFTEGFAN